MIEKICTDKQKELVNELFFEEYYHHRHPDWRFGTPDFPHEPECYANFSAINPSFVSFKKADPGIIWLHEYCSTDRPDPSDLTEYLGLSFLQGASLYAISESSWLTDILTDNGFRPCCDLIQLHCRIDSAPLPDTHITDLTEEDIPEAFRCDNAFAPLWHIDADEFRLACEASSLRLKYAEDGIIAGYVICSEEQGSVHINRIAVSEDQQGRGIGTALISSVIACGVRSGITEFSVNTSDRDREALDLYRKFGFTPDGFRSPVFRKAIPGNENS